MGPTVTLKGFLPSGFGRERVLEPSLFCCSFKRATIIFPFKLSGSVCTKFSTLSLSYTLHLCLNSVSWTPLPQALHIKVMADVFSFLSFCCHCQNSSPLSLASLHHLQVHSKSTLLLIIMGMLHK